jgi:leader peptidase (prepilin peptidase) / N-methyltransferase
MEPVIFQLIAFIFGSCIGSFLNVCIYRIPNKKSIVSPSSYCPKCKKSIPFYLNIPIFGYIFTGGICHNCKDSISLRYPLVETFTGIMAVITINAFGPTPAFLLYFTFISTLVVISFIDFDLQIIPDVISLPGIVVFFFSFLFTDLMTAKDAFFGILLGGGSLYLVAVLYHLIRKVDGMGGGDIKLLAMIGGTIGARGVLFTLFMGSLLGAVVGFATMVLTKNRNRQFRMPFGPYLSIASAIYIFWGDPIIRGYIIFITS